PANELLAQAGAKLEWDEGLNEFAPISLPDGGFAAGEVAATHTLEEIEREGGLAGVQGAAGGGGGQGGGRGRGRGARGGPEGGLAEAVSQKRAERVVWTAGYLPDAAGKKDFVCLCEDVTRKDVKQSIDEGYSSMELLKRYSTISMGPCQGKMCNMSAMWVCAN